MVSDLILITGASCVRGTLELYMEQLASAGIETLVIDNSNMPNINGGGCLKYRVDTFREYAKQYQHYQFIVFSDAFDVTFYGTKEEVIAKIPRDYLLHAAEKNCYPPECLDLTIPDRGPWRYANGGLVAGTPQSFIEWCDAAEKHPRYQPSALDQWFLNLLVSEESKYGVIDFNTDLFLCLFGGYDELKFENGKPVNTAYGTTPNFLHANGKWSAAEMFDRYARSLK